MKHIGQKFMIDQTKNEQKEETAIRFNKIILLTYFQNKIK